MAGGGHFWYGICYAVEKLLWFFSEHFSLFLQGNLLFLSSSAIKGQRQNFS